MLRATIRHLSIRGLLGLVRPGRGLARITTIIILLIIIMIIKIMIIMILMSIIISIITIITIIIITIVQTTFPFRPTASLTVPQEGYAKRGSKKRLTLKGLKSSDSKVTCLVI